MASPAIIESKTCECTCECTSDEGCSCVCSVPCAFNSENKTIQWTCDCKCSSGEKGGKRCCKSTFQIRCNNTDQACSPTDTELFTAKCECEGQECVLQIRKCKGCEVIGVQCDCREGASCASNKAPASSECCKGSHCETGHGWPERIAHIHSSYVGQEGATERYEKIDFCTSLFTL